MIGFFRQNLEKVAVGKGCAWELREKGARKRSFVSVGNWSGVVVVGKVGVPCHDSVLLLHPVSLLRLPWW